MFYRLGDEFGDFSNFARYPISINGGLFQTSEAAYQAARFPDNPDIQRLIADAENPMETKALARLDHQNGRFPPRRDAVGRFGETVPEFREIFSHSGKHQRPDDRRAHAGR